MKKLILNVDLERVKRGTELRIVDNDVYCSRKPDSINHYFLCRVSEIPLYIEKGIIREEWDLEYNEKDMLGFGEYVLRKCKAGYDSAAMEDLLWSFLGKEKLK